MGIRRYIRLSTACVGKNFQVVTFYCTFVSKEGEELKSLQLKRDGSVMFEFLPKQITQIKAQVLRNLYFSTLRLKTFQPFDKVQVLDYCKLKESKKI